MAGSVISTPRVVGCNGEVQTGRSPAPVLSLPKGKGYGASPYPLRGGWVGKGTIKPGLRSAKS